MFKIVEIDHKLYIRNPQDELVKNEYGQAIWFAGPIGAEKALKRLNSGKQLLTPKVKGVVDNRHRNWRKRR